VFAFGNTYYLFHALRGAAETERKMKVSKIKMKLFGKSAVLFRVLDAQGQVLQVLETEAEALGWIAAH
jgi:transposase-like protein